MKVFVNYDDARWEKYKIDFQRIASAAGPRRKDAEVSITLVDDAMIYALNLQYRGMDKPTNVLSFELGDDLLLGDIYISLDTVSREAAALGISVEEHTAHMVVHGMLHLQGYDHIEDSDASVMESREVKILKSLGVRNPYAEKGAMTRLRALARCGLLAILGAAAALGFAPFHLWPVTILAFGAAYWILTRDGAVSWWRGLLRAAPFGAAYSIAMFWWSLHSIFVVPELAREFAIWTVPGVLGLGLAGALVFSVPFAAAAAVGACARPFVFAGLGAAVLWAREWMFTGFPWNPIANIFINITPVANSMALYGALGLTFATMGIIAASVEILRDKKRAMCWISGLVFVLMIVGGAVFGVHNAAISDAAKSGPLIRIVQPATSQDQKMSYSRDDAVARAERNVRNLLALGAGGDVRPDLIVYPETTYPFVITDDDMPFSKILNTDVVLGAMSYRDGRLYNSMILADASGRVVRTYDKAHLVPFGEYGPLGVMPSPTNLAKGEGAEIISVNNGDGFSFAPAICYEIIFSDSLIPSGAQPDAIINITNDTWFGKTPGTYQHLDMTPYRRIGRDWWMVLILLSASIGAIAASRRRD